MLVKEWIMNAQNNEKWGKKGSLKYCFMVINDNDLGLQLNNSQCFSGIYDFQSIIQQNKD